MPRPPFRPRAAYRHWQPIVTRWSDNDMYGHVNNAVYYHWFDTAVNNWLFAAGLLDVAGGATIGLVVETGCRYAKPLSYPGDVEIGLLVETVGSSSVTYGLGAFEPGNDVAAAEAVFTHVYVGRDDRRPRALSTEWRDALRRLLIAD